MTESRALDAVVAKAQGLLAHQAEARRVQREMLADGRLKRFDVKVRARVRFYFNDEVDLVVIAADEAEARRIMEEADGDNPIIDRIEEHALAEQRCDDIDFTIVALAAAKEPTR
jgi:hypothetical protein